MKRVIIALFLSTPCFAGSVSGGGGGAAKLLHILGSEEYSRVDSVTIDESAFKELSGRPLSLDLMRKPSLSIKSIDFENREILLRRDDGRILKAQQIFEDSDIIP